MLFETIRLENGLFERLDFHQKRLDAARAELFPGAEKLVLEPLLVEAFAAEKARKSRAEQLRFSKNCHRTRVVYAEKAERIEFFEYAPKPIRRVRAVEAPGLEYAKKWADRAVFDRFLAKNAGFDDLLFLKNGLLTDTTFSNPAFFDGKKWLVPAEPLLAGTRRAAMLAAGEIFEAEIRLSDLRFFRKWSLLNAMRGLEIELPMAAIEGF